MDFEFEWHLKPRPTSSLVWAIYVWTCFHSDFSRDWGQAYRSSIIVPGCHQPIGKICQKYFSIRLSSQPAQSTSSILRQCMLPPCAVRNRDISQFECTLLLCWESFARGAASLLLSVHLRRWRHSKDSSRERQRMCRFRPWIRVPTRYFFQPSHILPSECNCMLPS